MSCALSALTFELIASSHRCGGLQSWMPCKKRDVRNQLSAKGSASPFRDGLMRPPYVDIIRGGGGICRLQRLVLPLWLGRLVSFFLPSAPGFVSAQPLDRRLGRASLASRPRRLLRLPAWLRSVSSDFPGKCLCTCRDPTHQREPRSIGEPL